MLEIKQVEINEGLKKIDQIKIKLEEKQIEIQDLKEKIKQEEEKQIHIKKLTSRK